MKRKIAALIMTAILLISFLPVYADGSKSVRILFTHDMHSHLEQASRLATLIHEERETYGGGNTILLDGGDFSQGTIYQTAYTTDALELGMLSKLGYTAAAIGNHEWDEGGQAFADMLVAAENEYSNLPPILCANLKTAQVQTLVQKNVIDSLSEYNQKAGASSKDYYIYETENGVKIGIFAVSGNNSVEESPDSGMVWSNYIEAAKDVAAQLEGQCDAIICLSHSGTDGNGESGEDIALAKAVPEINMIVSAHTHTSYEEPVYVGNTLIASAGCYAQNLGTVTMQIDSLGNVTFDDYQLRPVDTSVTKNSVVEAIVSWELQQINENYFASYGYSADEVIAHSSFDFMTMDEMKEDNTEYPLGNLIADSYIYAARANGIEDIDVALVGFGTIRDTLSKGNITVSNVFDICPLGVSEDGSSGHPLIAAYITGAELKLLVQLDASFGKTYSEVRMNYSGLRCRFNTNRVILDKATDIRLYDEFGILGERNIVDNKLYKVCCNMYAASMLDMVKDMTGGIVKIEPKDAEGNPIDDLYSCALKDKDGKDIKEWYALASYLQSLDEIPDYYKEAAGRKVKISDGSLPALLKTPGIPTMIAIAVIVLAILVLYCLIRLIARVIRWIMEVHK